MIKFSVIVPTYKVERYLPHCIESIINQTYPQLEIILVNDGSPDRCLEIMEDYARQDERIIVVSQENGGLSAARNAGLRIATGDYVAFVDSDDWIEKNMFSELAIHLGSVNPDFTCFRFQYDNEQSGSHFLYGNPYPMSEMEVQNVIIEDTKRVRHIPTSAWSKVYSRSFLTKYSLQFEPGIVNEDTLFSIQVACRAHKVTFLNKLFYHTIEREGSISRSSQERLFLDMHTALLKAKEYMVSLDCFERFQYLYEARYLKSMLYNLLQAAQRLSYKEFVNVRNICLCRTLYKEYDRYSIHANLPLKHRVMLAVAKSAPLFYALVKGLNVVGWKMH